MAVVVVAGAWALVSVAVCLLVGAVIARAQSRPEAPAPQGPRDAGPVLALALTARSEPGTRAPAVPGPRTSSEHLSPTTA